MRIEYVALDEIARWPRNPKKHDEPGIAGSINEHGFVQPPIFDEKTQRLVAGHGRLDALAARKAANLPPPARVLVRPGDGAWLVPVVRGVAFANEDAAARYVVADNRLVERGGWDDAMLLTILREQRALGANLGAMGYSLEDMTRLEQLATQTATGEGKKVSFFVGGGDTTPKLGGIEYRIIVVCQDERHQASTMERLEREGLKCRALMS